ncbi:MAG: hypothetical protein AAF376_11845 [Pseudomonadota bacterium]
MNVFLHVGAHRTATTTLQRMMGQSNATLAQAGIGYWGPKRTRGGLFQGLIGQSDAVMPWHVNRAAKRVRLNLRKSVDEGRICQVISEENALGSMRESLDGAYLYPDAGARVARVAAGMRDHPLTIGLAIRSYDAWWASVLAFRLTRGGPLPRRGFCERLITQTRRWRHVIADLAQAMPDVRLAVWTHEDYGARPDALITRLTGYDLALDGASEHLNSSATLTEMRCYLDECGADPGLIRHRAGRFMPFDEHQRAVLRAQYAEDLDWLAAGAGGLADYLDEPGQKTHGQTGLGRGYPDDGEYRRLAHAR